MTRTHVNNSGDDFYLFEDFYLFDDEFYLFEAEEERNTTAMEHRFKSARSLHVEVMVFFLTDNIISINISICFSRHIEVFGFFQLVYLRRKFSR